MTSGSTQISAPALTDIDLLAWLSQARTGDAFEYHRGFLALDRSCSGRALNENRRITLGPMASLALSLADRGLVDLVQRRIGTSDFSYWAIARLKAHSAPLSFSMLTPRESA